MVVDVPVQVQGAPMHSGLFGKRIVAQDYLSTFIGDRLNMTCGLKVPVTDRTVANPFFVVVANYQMLPAGQFFQIIRYRFPAAVR